MEERSMSLKELQSFITRTTIPVIKKKPTTFLGISKQPHYENVWSNIYAFFIKVSGEHRLNDLFIKSLVQLIGQKLNREYCFSNNFNIETEYYTLKKGRIDLLLFSNEEAIIIENKVYHQLFNDLNDYWESVNQTKKQGVILSLKKIYKIGNKNFINITHLELLQCVMGNIADYFSTANDKYLIYLKDFYLNIINMSNPIDFESLKFYYQNQKEIYDINNIRNSIAAHIKSEIDKACTLIDASLSLYKPGGDNEDRLRYYLCEKQKNLMFTIFFSRLIRTDRELLVIIEIQNDLLKQKDKLKEIQFSVEEDEFLKKDFYNKKERWAHFAFISYKLTDENIANLSEFIAFEINNGPIMSIFNKVKDVLIDKK